METSEQPAKPVRWDQVVESDQVFRAKTGQWYEVAENVALPGGKMRVRFVGVPKPFPVDSAATVPCRRGPTGQASEVLMTVLYSGSNGRGN